MTSDACRFSNFNTLTVGAPLGVRQESGAFYDSNDIINQVASPPPPRDRDRGMGVGVGMGAGVWITQFPPSADIQTRSVVAVMRKSGHTGHSCGVRSISTWTRTCIKRGSSDE